MVEEVRNYCIVHFSPLEKYPPIVNFLRYLDDHIDKKTIIHVLTLHPGKNRDLVEIGNIRIHRLIRWSDDLTRSQRLFLYFQFNCLSLRFLLNHKPIAVMYYETLSAGGPCIYKLLRPNRCRLFIHYHEYMSPKEYKQGMVINRWLHNLERLLYARAEWISHTNETREQLFTNDIGIKKKLSTYTLPNYPSGNWYTIASKVNRNNRPEIGFVYVGALSMHTMFTKEMALFISNNVGKCYWDIYSDNCEAEVMSFLKELAAPNISFKESVSYNTLPQILPRYDIGVILYKGDTPNYAYNAPNKFFEYSAAGLTVWFPPGMKGMMPYEQQEKKPFVLCVEFDNLTLPSESEARRIEQLPAQMYLAENVYSRLWEKINKK